MEFVANVWGQAHLQRSEKFGQGMARKKGIDRNFTRGPPDSPEKKTRGKGRG